MAKVLVTSKAKALREIILKNLLTTLKKIHKNTLQILILINALWNLSLLHLVRWPQVV